MQCSVGKSKQDGGGVCVWEKAFFSGLNSVCAGKQNRDFSSKMWLGSSSDKGRCGAQLMRWCCAAFFWDPVRSTNINKKKSRQCPQQFGYSEWLKRLSAGWISGECNIHQQLVLLFPTNRNVYKTPVPDVAAHHCGMESSADSLQAPEGPCMNRVHQADIAYICHLCCPPVQLLSQSGHSEKVKNGRSMLGSHVKFDACLNPKF